MISPEKASPARGWLIVGASTLLMFGNYGTSGSFGVFLKPIVDELGCTRAMASAAMSMVMGLSGLIGIVAGRLSDKYGARVLIATGIIMGVLGYLLMYRVSSLWQLYAYFGLMVGVCLGTGFSPTLATVSRWFTRKRVLAIGITTGGIAVGQTVLTPLVAYFITGYGWRPAYLLLAIILLITAVPAVILLGARPQQRIAVSRSADSEDGDIEGREPPRGWSTREATKTFRFWMLVIIGFVTATGFYFVQVHIVAYATDAGISVTAAALILTFVSIGSIVVQFVVWSLCKIGNKYAIIILLALQAVTLLLLMGTTSFWMLVVLGTVFGFGFGGSTTVRLAMISDIFGTRSLGAILGLISTAFAAGGIVGPILAGYIFDLSHSYHIAFLAGGLLLAVGVICAFFIKAPADSL